MQFESVIGLEVHVELATRSKLFCGCANQFGAAPNTLVCPICLGLPGVLPSVNRRAVEFHLLAARALECAVPTFSKFDRKNYFYPDMPKNFQTSQYDLPLAGLGRLEIETSDGPMTVGITRIHLEEDTGKSVHYEERAGQLVPGRLGGSDLSLVDYNRAGVPLMEIVSEPDMRTPEQAAAYVMALRDILVWLGISDCKMEEGSLRCDANVSIRPVGATELGTKTEIKNMNSFKSVRAAVEHEIARQIKVVSEGGRIVQETRGWDENAGRTISMRSKEEAHDYRYFPEPDLPLLEIDASLREALPLPELPKACIQRFVSDYGLGLKEAKLMASSRTQADFFEATCKLGAEPAQAANWLANEVSRLVNETGVPLLESRVTPELLAELIALVKAGKVNHRGAKEMLPRIFNEGGSPSEWVDKLGLGQLSDTGALLTIIREVVAANPGPIAEFKGGKAKALNALVGQIMKKTGGRANPADLNRMLAEVVQEA